jgi:hypothetical protein
MKWTTGVLLTAFWTLFSASSSCASTLYGSSSFGEVSTFWSIDQDTGAATALFPGTGLTDLASDWRPGSFRIRGIRSSHALTLVDPTTGNQPLVGITPPSIEGLAFNVADGILYGVGGGDLFRIDPTTAATTLVGRTGFSYACLGSDLNGNLFGVTFPDNILVRINPATGIAQAIGSLGTVLISDLAVRPEDGVLFGVRNVIPQPNQPFAYSLVKVDTATAATTLVGNEQLNKTMGALAFSPAVPEPSALSLAAIAATVAGARRTRLWW